MCILIVFFFSYSQFDWHWVTGRKLVNHSCKMVTHSLLHPQNPKHFTVCFYQFQHLLQMFLRHRDKQSLGHPWWWWHAVCQENPKLNLSRLRHIQQTAVGFATGKASVPLTDEEPGGDHWRNIPWEERWATGRATWLEFFYATRHGINPVIKGTYDGVTNHITRSSSS